MSDIAGLSAIAGTTSAQTIQAGTVRDRGFEGSYYHLTAGPAEPHILRLDLVPGAPTTAHRRTMLSFAQTTDIHVQDEQSPGRFEFVDRLTGPEPLHLLTPSYRPQEFLQLYACEAMIRSINSLGRNPATGAGVDLLVCTGDLTDNCQTNELRCRREVHRGAGTEQYWHPWGITPSPAIAYANSGVRRARGQVHEA